MNKLFRKELREQTKVALLGLVIFTVILLGAYKSCVSPLVSFDTWGGQLQGDTMQPLMASLLHNEAGFFCAIFGALLGWLQIHAERHRDLWAYLVHRPIARTAILRSKIAAGLCLYALAAGLPLLGLVAVAGTPGRVAAPFEWGMTLPVLAIFMTGIVYYFAGMLTGLRQARWYGSRCLGLGLAIIASFAAFSVPEFWQALLVCVIAGAILAAAVWGCFKSGGYYRGQSIPGKLALTLTCAAGALVIIGATVSLVTMLLPEARPEAQPDYALTRDGAVYKVTRHNIEEIEIVDLNGKPLLDKKTGQKIREKEFNEQRPLSAGLSAFFGTRDEWTHRDRAEYMNNLRFFSPWRISGRSLWYLTPEGRLVGFDSMSRQRIGILEPNGGFIRERDYYNWFNAYDLSRLLASSTTAYLVDLDNRSLKPIFTATNEERIGGYAEPERRWEKTAWQSALVVTQHSIRLLDLDGRTEWVIPYQPSYPVYSSIEVSFLEPTNQFAVKFQPDYEANKKAGWKLPIHVEWLTTKEGITNSLDLPLIPQSENEDLLDRLAAALLMPPALLPSLWDDSDRIWDVLSLIPAILCATVGWRLGRRYSFSGKAQAGWGVFHLLLGLPGLLAFLSVQEWPARETCPSCKKLRVVDREKCPHCGADFAPPEKTGTEIFEPLAAN